MAIRTAALLGAAAIVAAACDNSSTKPGKPEGSTAPVETRVPPPAPAPAADVGPGRLDSETLRAAATAQGVERIKIETEADGKVRYLAVTHNDAAALPEPVVELLAKQYPGGKILKYEAEMVDRHGRLFEVEVETQDKQRCEYSAKADGTLVYSECHIDPAALPEKIRADVERAFPGAPIKEAEKKVVVGGEEEFEVELESGGRVHELYFKADGTRFRHELVIPAIVEVPAD